MSTTAAPPPANPFGGESGFEATDALWVMISTFIIFTMQTGFGLLESGLVSHKSEANVMVKNMLDVSLGGLAYWFLGYGFMFGTNNDDSKKFAGDGSFMIRSELENGDQYSLFFFQLSFATAATTIVSGSVAERVKLKSYIIFAVINTGLIYVMPAHWVWHSDGWLYGKCYDYAGSAVVHMAGGSSAIAATLILGPRHKRFSGSKNKYTMASPTNVVLGTFFLWWGWIGFNCGSTYGLSGGRWKLASRVAAVTMNGAMAGGLGAMILNLIMERKRKYLLDIPDLCSGILGGLVSITACASVITTWEAVIIGFIGSLITIGATHLINFMRVDDPVGCIAVHWFSGLWSMIATGFFAHKVPDSLEEDGIFRGGNGSLLGWNLLTCLVVTAWNGGLTAIVFLTMKYTIGIRMDLDEEIRGSDEVEHNIHEFDPKSGVRRTHSLGRRVSKDVSQNNVRIVNIRPNQSQVELKENEAYEIDGDRYGQKNGDANM